MKQLLLLTCMSTIGFSVYSQTISEPKTIEDSDAYAISPNAQYLVSEGYSGMKIYNLAADRTYDYTENGDNGKYQSGMANCVSDNGIIIGYDSVDGAVYWKDGAWHKLKGRAQGSGSNLVNSITADGSRICGTLGMASLSYDDDVLRQAPCIWNWDEAKGDFGTPVILPYPKLDFSGRVPQLVTAVDISHDGKTIVGQVVTAAGWVRYPIIYKENEVGDWSFVIPDDKVLHPEGMVFPEYPGDEGPMIPSEETYMTEAEKAAYSAAYNEYVNSGYTKPEPQYKDFMTKEEYNAFEKAYAEFLVASDAWESKFNAWNRVYNKIADTIPDYEFNSIRISPDGKKYANTIIVEQYITALDGFTAYAHIWTFDIATGDITKYDQHDDFILTYLANDGIALAATNLVDDPESYVLKDGECIDMQNYITGRIPEYGSWMEDNMTQTIGVHGTDEEEGEVVYVDKVVTGRACGTPDMSVVALGVNNVWDLVDDGNSFIFDLRAGSGITNTIQEAGNNMIFDLQGRRLMDATNPGIFIINGEKKAIR